MKLHNSDICRAQIQGSSNTVQWQKVLCSCQAVPTEHHKITQKEVCIQTCVHAWMHAQVLTCKHSSVYVKCIIDYDMS